MATPGSGSGKYPDNEGPANAFDRNLQSKYNSFGGEGFDFHGGKD